MIIRIMDEAYTSPIEVRSNQELYFEGIEFWNFGAYETIRDIYVGF